MNCSPTITAQDFSTIHNAVCELDSLVYRLEDVLKPELYNKLVKARDDIRKGLEGAYKQDSQTFDSKYEHYNKVREELGLSSVWSLYEVEDLNNSHSFKNVTKVVYRAHWGKKPVSVAIVGNTWASLYVAADACIRDSGDDHHIFIESFTQEGDALILSTGS